MPLTWLILICTIEYQIIANFRLKDGIIRGVGAYSRGGTYSIILCQGWALALIQGGT